MEGRYTRMGGCWIMPPLDLYDVGFVGAVGSGGGGLVDDGSSSYTSKTTSGGKDYYKFNSSGNLVITGSGTVKVMLVGGGGNGVLKYYGTGSGAGGMVYSDINVTANNYTVTIGGSMTDTSGFGKTALKGAYGKGSYNTAAAGGCGCGNKSGGDLSDTYTIGDQSTSA